MSKPIKREHLNWELVKGGGGVILGWGGCIILGWEGGFILGGKGGGGYFNVGESALERGHLKNIREVLGRGGYSEQSTSR